MCHIRKPLALAAGLNAGIFLIEIITGTIGHSNSLIMDGIHNFSDELGLVCLFLAYQLPVKMSKTLQRSANIFNSCGLIALSGIVIWVSIRRILNPIQTLGFIPIFVGTVSAIANLYVAKVLKPFVKQSAAIRLAYLHNLGDVLVSFVPALAGVIIILTGKSFFDSIIAIIIGIWLIWSTITEISKSYNELIFPENAVCPHENIEFMASTSFY